LNAAARAGLAGKRESFYAAAAHSTLLDVRTRLYQDQGNEALRIR
jgi:hypothetical protein